MISYLIKSGLCLAILLAFYHLVLEREKMHQFNRFYLLGSVLFSFLVPFVIIYVEAPPKVTSELTEAMMSPIVVETSTTNNWGASEYALMVYLSITFVMFIRFIKSLLDIILKIKQHQITSYQSAKLVLVKDDILPHTFWNYIFINKEEYLSKKVEKELFTHELTHVTQKHTLDVLIVEALQIVLWFNPFFYPLKKAIQLNHEFLADDNVIASHQDIPKYQYLLLDKAAWKNKYYLASNLNYSLTKKRLLMMKTKNSKSTIRWKKLAIIPLLGVLIFLFANRVEAQTTKKKIEVKEVKNKGATKAQMTTYSDLFREADKNKQFKMKDVKKMQYIYGLMTDKQKRSVKNINDHLPPPPPRPVKIEVVEKKKIPPPPPPRKKKVKKVKEVKVKKSPKVLKKTKELKEEIEIVEEAEVLEKMEIIEVPEEVEEEEVEIKRDSDWDKFEERIANPKKEIIIEEKEIPLTEYKERIREDSESSKESYERMVEAGARFYLNGKKATAKEVRPYFFEKKNKVKTFKVKDNNGDIKVRIKTRR